MHLHNIIDGSTLVGRKNINELSIEKHDVIVLAAPTGNRLAVNGNPDKDRADCELILEALFDTEFDHLIHISTVDTYAGLVSDSSLPGSATPKSYYGVNRSWLESKIIDLNDSHVIRLPSIVGSTIKKNILYDIKHHQWLDSINLDSQIQWYPLSWLLNDIVHVVSHGIPYLNLVSAPIENRSIIEKFRPNLLEQLEKNNCPKVSYNIHTAPGSYHVGMEIIWQKFEEFFID